MKDDDLTSILAELGGGSSPATDWREYFHAIRERLWVLLLCLTLAGIGAAIFMSRQESRFRARSVIFLEQEQDRVLDKVKGVREEAVGSIDMINTVVDLLTSYQFAVRVAERTKLNEDPRLLARIPSPAAISVPEAAGALAKCVSSQYRKNTRLIDIFVTHADPALATSLANAYADEYLRFVFEKRTEANKAAQLFLFEEVERLRKKMRVSEEAMQSFRERERASSLESLQETTQAKLTGLKTQLAEMEQRIFLLEADLKVARANVGNPEELLRLPSIARASAGKPGELRLPTDAQDIPGNLDELQPLSSGDSEQKVARLTQAIAEQDRTLMLLSLRYRAKHPAYIAAHAMKESLVAERSNVLKNVVALLETSKGHMEEQYAGMKKARDEQEERLMVVTGKSVEYNDLKRGLETDTTMYQSVLSRMNEIDVTKGLTDSPVRIHERATGAMPVSLTAVKVYGGGLFAGLAIGIALILGLHFLDHSIQTVEQAEQATGLPVLSAVPRKKKLKGGADDRVLDAIIDRHGMVAESFRSLRASLAMLAHADARRSFLFTSAMPSEGKTFCSTNFAATLSQQGFRTLIIDADLRKPMISPVFFGEHRKPGLSEVLAGQVTLDEAVFSTEIENLSILTAGGRSPNPAELIATPRMKEVLEEALRQYDRVVIDTAPILAVSDTLLIAPHVDVSCIIIRSNSTSRKTAARAVRALSDIKCRPAGVVLNFLPTGSGSEYYYSGKYYGSYSSKGVYGAKT